MSRLTFGSTRASGKERMLSASDAGARVSGEAAIVTRAAKPRESEPALISANCSLPPLNHGNEVIKLKVGGNMKFDSNVESSLTVANLGGVKWS